MGKTLEFCFCEPPLDSLDGDATKLRLLFQCVFSIKIMSAEIVGLEARNKPGNRAQRQGTVSQ
jgi:hypothetical protein